MDSSSKSHHRSSFFNQETLQHRLRSLIDGAREYWTYAIFWQSSVVDYGGPSLLGWGDGYYKGEKDKGKRKNPCSSSSVMEQEHRKKVLPELHSLSAGIQGSADDAVNVEVTDTEGFFLVSMTQSFIDGSGLPGHALYNSSLVWVTGAERLASLHCERARQAQGCGIQTLACIPLADGVLELGSSSVILPHSEFDLLDRVRPLFNFRNNICIQEIVTDSAGFSSIPSPIFPGYESESSVGNRPMFQQGDSSSQRDKRTRSNSNSDSGSRYLEVFAQILRGGKRHSTKFGFQETVPLSTSVCFPQLTMSRQYLPVLEVREKMRGWTVLIQVVEKGNVQLSRRMAAKTYRRLLFTDSHGTKVSAVIYGNDIHYFAGMLHPFKRYYILNASVCIQEPKYRVTDYEYYWIINNTTLVEEHVEPSPPTLPCTFQLAKFNDLFRFANTENLQNLQAVIVHAFPPKEQASHLTTRDFVIINEEKKPMLLTMFNEFEQNEGALLANSIANANVIIGMRLKVTTFNSLSLTTTLSSCLLVNPPTQQTNRLKEWYNVTKEEIAQLVEQMAYKDSNKLLPPPKEEDIVDIESVVATVKTAWIKGKAKLIPGQARYWYTACVNCKKSIHADIEWTIECPSCKEDSKVEARCRIGIMLDDGMSSINTTIFGADAEKLIPYTGLQLKEADDQEAPLFAELAASIQKHIIVCFVRHYDLDNQGQKDARYSIVKVYTIEEVTQLELAATYQGSPKTLLQLPATAEAGQYSSSNEDFFIPTTKKVLESIAESSTNAQKLSPSLSRVKRNLHFNDTPGEDQAMIAENVGETTLQGALERIRLTQIFTNQVI